MKMMFQLRGLLFLFAFGLAPFAFSQTGDVDKGKTIAQVEKELAEIAQHILGSDSTDYKIEINKEFITRLTYLLQRPESFNYPFDSLKTISHQRAQDNSFRIFTWYFVDRPSGLLYADVAHYYFGLIQRKYVTQAGETQYIVIPLMEDGHIPPGADGITLDNFHWLGALYYPIKGTHAIPTYSAETYKLVGVANPTVRVDSSQRKLTVTYVPGRPKGRRFKEIYALEYHTHDMEKVKNNYYVLTGWNGWDNHGSFKIVEVMSFDPEDSSRAIFGAPVFYFDAMPKSRAIFKYSEFSTFTLNTNYIKTGPFKMFRKALLVYDHLAKNNKAMPSSKVWDMGPDGTQDALEYLDKYDCFIVHRNVTLADKFNDRQHRKHLRDIHKTQEQIASQDTVMQLNYFPDNKMARQNQKEMKRQKQESDRKLKESGIEMPRGRREDGIPEEQ